MESNPARGPCRVAISDTTKTIIQFNTSLSGYPVQLPADIRMGVE